MTGFFHRFGDILCILLSFSIVILTTSEILHNFHVSAVVRITIEKLSKFTKYHQNCENFQSFIFKNSTNYFFLITNLNHPKNSILGFFIDSAIVAPTYRGRHRHQSWGTDPAGGRAPAAGGLDAAGQCKSIYK